MLLLTVENADDGLRRIADGRRTTPVDAGDSSSACDDDRRAPPSIIIDEA
jgi:hypothetical protein